LSQSCQIGCKFLRYKRRPNGGRFALADKVFRVEEKRMDRIRYRLLTPLPVEFHRLGETWALRVDRMEPEMYGLDAWCDDSCAPYVAVRYDSPKRMDEAIYEEGVEVHPRSVFAWMFERLISERRAERLVVGVHLSRG